MENKRTVQAFLNFDSLDLDFLVIRFTRSIILVPEVFFFFGSFGGLGEVFLWSFGGIAERGRKEMFFSSLSPYGTWKYGKKEK